MQEPEAHAPIGKTVSVLGLTGWPVGDECAAPLPITSEMELLRQDSTTKHNRHIVSNWFAIWELGNCLFFSGEQLPGRIGSC